MANIAVVEFFGGTCSVGTVEARVGMETFHGVLMTISGSLLQVGSGTAQGNNWIYDHQTQVLRSDMVGMLAWPTGSPCTPNYRSVTNVGGNVMNLDAASGHTIWNGNSATTFGR